MSAKKDVHAQLVGWIVPGNDPRPIAEIAEALLVATYGCGDCGEIKDGRAYQWRRQAGYRYGVRRQAYCRSCQSRRTTEAERRLYERAPAVKAQRQQMRKAYAPRYREAKNAWRRADRQKDPLKYKEYYDAWRARHPDVRKRSQDAWRARQGLRMRVRRHTPAPDTPPPPASNAEGGEGTGEA